jgi:hypothetical protein
MRWPRNGRSARPPAGSSASRKVAVVNGDGECSSLEVEIDQLRSRPIAPGELAALRAIFWRQAALGRRLPAEAGVILIRGGE